jgi:hypothetical protein
MLKQSFKSVGKSLGLFYYIEDVKIHQLKLKNHEDYPKIVHLRLFQI